MTHSENQTIATPEPHMPIGLAALSRRAFRGEDLKAEWRELVIRLDRSPIDAAAMLDLSVIAQLNGMRDRGLALQALALEMAVHYRQTAGETGRTPIRLLALKSPGDMMANTPLEFLLEDSGVTLDSFYLHPEMPLPKALPDHDLAFVAVGQSEENRHLLEDLAGHLESWPRPVLNSPGSIARLTRDGLWSMLRSAPGIVIPRTLRVHRRELAQFASGRTSLRESLGMAYPIVVRPLTSHAGQGLVKIDDAASIDAYLAKQPEDYFYVSPFVDYASPDGQFRKCRIAFVDGRAFPVHQAISEHWMIHYLNAGMEQSAEKRAEEARFMETFDRQMAPRHRTAFEDLVERVGLDYFGIDCAETPDGKLLIFEADSSMIVHDMDPVELFPYKQENMQQLFGAFRGMLESRRKGHEQSEARAA